MNRRIRVRRLWQNLVTTRFALRRAFPAPVLDAIETAIRDSELRHGGEIQFAIETALEFGDLWRGVTAHEQAVRAFAELRVWDTERNNGVLVYVLLAEHRIEIVADRGYRERVAAAEWQGICVEIENAFAAGRFQDGSIAAVDAISTIIEAEFPHREDDADERPDRPIIL